MKFSVTTGGAAAHVDTFDEAIVVYRAQLKRGADANIGGVLTAAQQQRVAQVEAEFEQGLVVGGQE